MNFKKFSIQIVLLLLFSTTTVAETTPTPANNSIVQAHYAITVPPDREWSLQNGYKENEEVIFSRKIPQDKSSELIIQMSFQWHAINNEDFSKSCIEDLANRIRLYEFEKTEQEWEKFKVTDATMSKVEIGGKTFYTHEYIEKKKGMKKRVCLYLYFPRELGSESYFAARYSEQCSDVPSFQFRDADFIGALNTLEFHESIYKTSITKEAFLRAEEQLLNLQPGVPMDKSGLTWALEEIPLKDGGFRTLASANGWLGCLSGFGRGASSRFGCFYKQEGNTAYGKHIYGYLLNDIILIPRYSVHTEATVIPETEYNELEKAGAANIGWFLIPGVENSKTYFKELKLKEVHALNYPETDVEGMWQCPPVGKFIPVGKDVIYTYRCGGPFCDPNYNEKYRSPDAFQTIEESLKNIKLGIEFYDIFQIIGGKFIIFHPRGDAYTVWMKGLLNYKSEFFIQENTPQGYFTVWPFGYLKKKKLSSEYYEVPKLALIFKNEKVFKVVPYTSVEEVKKCFKEGGN